MDWKLRIVILPNGFVWIGWWRWNLAWAHMAPGGFNIRRWGKGAGLGRLAAKGPGKDDVLDPVPGFEAPMNAIIGAIVCDEEVWREKLPRPTDER